MRGKQLTDEVKAFIVQALACYDKPSAVVKSVKLEYGVEVSPQQVETYDPTKRAGRGLSKKWRDLREATRSAFLDSAAEIGIAQRNARLRGLDRMAGEAEKMKNYALAASLYEQAAKECGGLYTNKQRLEHTGANGEPIQTEAVTTFDLSKVEKEDRDLLRRILEQAAANKKKSKPN